MKTLITVLFAGLLLGGCDTISAALGPDVAGYLYTGSDKAMTAAAEGLEKYCDVAGDKVAIRKEFVDGVNERMDAKPDGTRYHAIAQDCSGDGQPDF